MSTHDISNLPMDKLKEMRSGVLSEVVDFRNTRSISVEDGVQKISQMLFQQFGKTDFQRIWISRHSLTVRLDYCRLFRHYMMQ